MNTRLKQMVCLIVTLAFALALTVAAPGASVAAGGDGPVAVAAKKKCGKKKSGSGDYRSANAVAAKKKCKKSGSKDGGAGAEDPVDPGEGDVVECVPGYDCFASRN